MIGFIELRVNRQRFVKELATIVESDYSLRNRVKPHTQTGRQFAHNSSQITTICRQMLSQTHHLLEAVMNLLKLYGLI